jgi:NADPH:quinone reductase
MDKGDPMRAVVVREFGGPEVLRIEELPDPVPGPGQLLVRVAAAGIQHVETQTRAGTLQGVSPAAPKELPWIPGREVVGEVASTGDGVDPTWLGRRVSGTTVDSGGYAELALVDVSVANQLPDTLDDAEAVSLLGTGRTALGIVKLAEIGAGDTVLIESAAGAVGVLSIQLARAAGAQRIIGLARGAAKLELVRRFGADHAVDYAKADWPEQVRTVAPEGVSVVLDANGGEVGAQAFELLAEGGRFLVFGLSSGTMTKLDPAHVAERGIRQLSYLGPPTGTRSPEAQQRQIREVLAAVTAGRLQTYVGGHYALDKAADAHAAVEARTTVGKIVLEP